MVTSRVHQHVITQISVQQVTVQRNNLLTCFESWGFKGADDGRCVESLGVRTAVFLAEGSAVTRMGATTTTGRTVPL